MLIEGDNIKVAEDLRVTVTYDDGSPSPIEDAEIGTMFLADGQGVLVDMSTAEVWVQEAFAHFYQTARYLRTYEQGAAEMLERYLNIFHGGGTVVLGDPTHRGAPYSVHYAIHSDLAKDQTHYAQQILHGEANEYRQWASGEVYLFTLEKRRTYLPEDGEGDPLYKWEDVDGISGCYVDLWDEAEVKDIIEGHFGLEV